jgi:hypothetical protein
VHGLLSLQITGPPGLHVPPPQVSFAVQAFPSSHGSVFGVWTQPLSTSHAAPTHGLLSSQFTAEPVHTAAQVSVSTIESTF